MRLCLCNCGVCILYACRPATAQASRFDLQEQCRSLNVPYTFVCSRLRILAAGGDGTVAWILKTVRELQLEPPPAVAVMPLGTGNDLSLSFGWGNTFLHKWIAVSPYTYMLTFLKKLQTWM